MAKYGYAVGRIRALEALMLSENHLIRMADAKDFEAAFLVLTETCYSENIDHLLKPFDFNELLELEFQFASKLLSSLAKDSKIIEILLKKFKGSVNETQTNSVLHNYIDELKTISKETNIPLFTKYVEAYSTLYELEEVLQKENTNHDELIERYRYTDFFKPVSAGIESLKKSGSLFYLEKEMENYLIHTVKHSRYFSFGIEPLIGFLIGKEIEMKNIRLVLTGKLLKVKPKDIKERLRTSYV